MWASRRNFYFWRHLYSFWYLRYIDNFSVHFLGDLLGYTAYASAYIIPVSSPKLRSEGQYVYLRDSNGETLSECTDTNYYSIDTLKINNSSVHHSFRTFVRSPVMLWIATQVGLQQALKLIKTSAASWKCITRSPPENSDWTNCLLIRFRKSFCHVHIASLQPSRRTVLHAYNRKSAFQIWLC